MHLFSPWQSTNEFDFAHLAYQKRSCCRGRRSHAGKVLVFGLPPTALSDAKVCLKWQGKAV